MGSNALWISRCSVGDGSSEFGNWEVIDVPDG